MSRLTALSRRSLLRLASFAPFAFLARTASADVAEEDCKTAAKCEIPTDSKDYDPCTDGPWCPSRKPKDDDPKKAERMKVHDNWTAECDELFDEFVAGMQSVNSSAKRNDVDPLTKRCMERVHGSLLSRKGIWKVYTRPTAGGEDSEMETNSKECAKLAGAVAQFLRDKEGSPKLMYPHYESAYRAVKCLKIECSETSIQGGIC